jgi:Predicted flavoprotein
MPLKLHVIIASTRPGRVGKPVGDWFYAQAREQGEFDVSLVDLADFNLPIYDEPNHPRMQKYQHEHTRAWSRSVAAADAFVLVTPEYNYGPTPALLNALDYLYLEWNYKPAAFVSYGGISGGMRAVEMTKGTLTTLKIVPIPEAIVIPNVPQFLKDGAFVPNEYHVADAGNVLKELHRWAGALKPLRG